MDCSPRVCLHPAANFRTPQHWVYVLGCCLVSWVRLLRRAFVTRPNPRRQTPANHPNGQRNPWRVLLLALHEHLRCELTAPAKPESGLARCQNSTSPPVSLAEQIANLVRLWPRLWATWRLQALHWRFQESLRRRLQAPASMAARPERTTSPHSPFGRRRVG